MTGVSIVRAVCQVERWWPQHKPDLSSFWSVFSIWCSPYLGLTSFWAYAKSDGRLLQDYIHVLSCVWIRSECPKAGTLFTMAVLPDLQRAASSTPHECMLGSPQLIPHTTGYLILLILNVFIIYNFKSVQATFFMKQIRGMKPDTIIF